MTTREWTKIKENRFKVESVYPKRVQEYVMIASQDWQKAMDVIDDIMKLRSLLQRVVTKAEEAT